MQPTLSGQPCLLQQGTVLRPWSLRVRIAKHLSGPRRDSDHHHHRGCACLSPLPWATLSLAVAVEVGHDCAYPILQAGKLRQGQAQGPAHAREEAASWVEVAEVAQGHPASHVATPPSFQMQTSGGSGLTNSHRAGWTLGAHVRCWPCAGEPRRGRGPVRQPPRLHPATGAWWSSSGWRRHAGPPPPHFLCESPSHRSDSEAGIQPRAARRGGRFLQSRVAGGVGPAPRLGPLV